MRKDIQTRKEVKMVNCSIKRGSEMEKEKKKMKEKYRAHKKRMFTLVL